MTDKDLIAKIKIAKKAMQSHEIGKHLKGSPYKWWRNLYNKYTRQLNERRSRRKVAKQIRMENVTVTQMFRKEYTAANKRERWGIIDRYRLAHPGWRRLLEYEVVDHAAKEFKRGEKRGRAPESFLKLMHDAAITQFNNAWPKKRYLKFNNDGPLLTKKSLIEYQFHNISGTSTNTAIVGTWVKGFIILLEKKTPNGNVFVLNNGYHAFTIKTENQLENLYYALTNFPLQKK